jgi:hypothetical protein
VAARGPLRPFAGLLASEQRRTRAGRSTCPRRSALRPPRAFRSCGPSHSPLHRLRPLRSHRCDESDDQSRDLACGHQPCDAWRLPGALRPARRCLCRHRRWCWLEDQSRWQRGKRCPGGVSRDAARSTGSGLARAGALLELIRRICASAESAANTMSCAARPRSEHPSAVGARRRPSNPETRPGTARRVALR